MNWPTIYIKKGINQRWYLIYHWENNVKMTLPTSMSSYTEIRNLRKTIIIRMNSGDYGLPDIFYQQWMYDIETDPALHRWAERNIQ